MTFANAYEQQLAIGPRPIGSIGSGSTEQEEFTDFQPGSIVATKNPLDIAIDSPKGLFAVQMPDNGIFYTRDGSFSLNTERQLTDKQGGLVLDTAGQPIQVPVGNVEFGSDGTVNVDGKSVGRIGVFDGTFTKVGGNLFKASGQPTAMDEIQLKPQSLESSNVNAIESMVQMITLNRSFDMAQRSITQQDDLTQRLIQSLQS
jgi:flagellar basal body rod protein FlgG